MLEFTGERVVPGLVDPDLWNEHFSRYLFAARLSRGKRVIDIGCGTGYGSAELARTAATVCGIDNSSEAIAWAAANYPAANLRFEEAPCNALPAADGSIDLAVAFEVIEHLADPEPMLAEVARVLAPGGQFVVSTPNADYYAESRSSAGPNPFHHREYVAGEFDVALRKHFPHVVIFLQNHVAGISFQATNGHSSATPTVHSGGSADAAQAHFFVAVCAQSPQVDSPTFVYLPSTSNVLREREHHIERLKSEMRQKDDWLNASLADHEALVEKHRVQKEELEAANIWARKRDEELAEKIAHVAALDLQIEDLNSQLSAAVAAYATKDEEALNLHRDLVARTVELEAKVAELGLAVDALHHVEAELAERTQWAESLNEDREALSARLQHVRASRWVRLGRKLNMGPDLRQ